MLKSARFYRTLGIISCVLCLAALAVVGSVYYRQREVQREAQAFLEELKTLNITQVMPDEIARLALRYHGIKPAYAPPCTAEQCQYDFVFENKLLSSLLLAPHTRFGSTIMFGDAGVQLLSSGLTSNVSDPPQGQIHLAVLVEERPANTQESAEVQVTQDGGSRPWRTRTRLLPSASRSLREQAYNFNLDCLSRLGGCKTLGDLMISVWPPTGSGEFQARDK